MAFVKCRECGKDITSTAKTCPECGIPTPDPETFELIGLAKTFGVKKSKIDRLRDDKELLRRATREKLESDAIEKVLADEKIALVEARTSRRNSIIIIVVFSLFLVSLTAHLLSLLFQS